MADLRNIVWRCSGVKDCAALSLYRDLRDQNPDRQLMAKAIAAFGEPECGQSNMLALKQAAEYARSVGRKPEADIFDQLPRKTVKPQFGKTDIAAELKVAAKAKAMVLGETTIVLKPGMRVGIQVERVARDWASYEMRWDLSRKLIPATLSGYHEGAFVHKIAEFANIEITPLAGTLIAKKGEQWYGPDEKGIFRFEVLPDKVTYPTTHVAGDMGWIEDTHGISAVVSQALEFNSQVVVGCGDSEGKAEAAFYLAQKGLDVVMPGDRYTNLLLGYNAKGVLIGTAPVKLRKGTAVSGHQPVQFRLNEPMPVEANAMTAEKILTTSRSRSLGTVSDRVVPRHEIGERIIISRGFCLENQTFSFQYPFSGAFWTFCSPKRRFSAVATMSGCLRSCSAKSRSLTTTSPVG